MVHSIAVNNIHAINPLIFHIVKIPLNILMRVDDIMVRALFFIARIMGSVA